MVGRQALVTGASEDCNPSLNAAGLPDVHGNIRPCSRLPSPSGCATATPTQRRCTLHLGKLAVGAPQIHAATRSYAKVKLVTRLGDSAFLQGPNVPPRFACGWACGCDVHMPPSREAQPTHKQSGLQPAPQGGRAALARHRAYRPSHSRQQRTEAAAFGSESGEFARACELPDRRSQALTGPHNGQRLFDCRGCRAA